MGKALICSLVFGASGLTLNKSSRLSPASIIQWNNERLLFGELMLPQQLAAMFTQHFISVSFIVFIYLFLWFASASYTNMDMVIEHTHTNTHIYLSVIPRHFALHVLRLQQLTVSITNKNEEKKKIQPYRQPLLLKDTFQGDAYFCGELPTSRIRTRVQFASDERVISVPLRRLVCCCLSPSHAR